MDATLFLQWVRGPGLIIASAIFAFGIVLRILEIAWLKRAPNLAEHRDSGPRHGAITVFRRFLPADAGTFQRSGFIIVAGYGFHLGFLGVLFLYAPHIELIDSITGLRWPSAPNSMIDFLSVIAIASMLALLWYRISSPLLRFLSDGEDYLVWFLSFLPLLTGYLCFHHLWLNYTWLLGMHIFSAELLLVMFPFTKLTHVFTWVIARWYNGVIAGEKGVQS